MEKIFPVKFQFLNRLSVCKGKVFLVSYSYFLFPLGKEQFFISIVSLIILPLRHSFNERNQHLPDGMGKNIAKALVFHKKNCLNHSMVPRELAYLWIYKNKEQNTLFSSSNNTAELETYVAFTQSSATHCLGSSI